MAARVVAHPSPHNESLTLFETTTASSGSTIKEVSVTELVDTPKRSKRGIERSAYFDKGASGDIEDAAESFPSAVKVKEEEGKRSRNGSPKKKVCMALDFPHPAPPNWEETYAAIKEMRQSIVAPVDTMGCDTAKWHETDPKARRLSTLVSLMLSSQTKDPVTDAAVQNLRTALGGSITLEALLAADENTIPDAISKVGFWRRKTGYIKQMAERLRDDFGGDVPKTVDELCSLVGVGPKMAFLCLQTAWGINDGIGVDVHVHRITNRLGWHKRPSKNPEETRLNLQSWLPKELHPEINGLLVGFGQTICLPVSPRCADCTLSAGGICPSARLPKKRSRTLTRKKLVRRTDSETLLEVAQKMEEEATGTDQELKVEVHAEQRVKLEDHEQVNAKG